MSALCPHNISLVRHRSFVRCCADIYLQGYMSALYPSSVFSSNQSLSTFRSIELISSFSIQFIVDIKSSWDLTKQRTSVEKELIHPFQNHAFTDPFKLSSKSRHPYSMYSKPRIFSSFRLDLLLKNSHCVTQWSTVSPKQNSYAKMVVKNSTLIENPSS